uniref:Transmembrane protein 169b n=1 Tax=Eptatretus burgeri TaxID=7764 RepID=A0A8C4WY83_EPTBU
MILQNSRRTTTLPWPRSPGLHPLLFLFSFRSERFFFSARSPPIGWGTRAAMLALGSLGRGKHSMPFFGAELPADAMEAPEADDGPSPDEASTTPSLLPKSNERIGVQTDLGDGRFVTLTGTITRGKKKGHLVDIHLSLTEKELLELSGQDEAEGGGPGQPLTEDHSPSRCHCGLARGPHVVAWSVLCAPFVFAVALVVAFYYGTITWYNVFLVYNEQRTFWHKVTLCPLLMLFYPPLIMAASIALALHAVTSQFTCTFALWWQAARDPEKGFFGWLCSHLGLEECAPYSIVELLDSQSLPTG